MGGVCTYVLVSGLKFQESGSPEEPKTVSVLNVGATGANLRSDHNAFEENRPTEKEVFYEQYVDIRGDRMDDLNLSRYGVRHDCNEQTKLVNLLMLQLDRMGRRTSQRDVNSIISILVNPSLNLKK